MAMMATRLHRFDPLAHLETPQDVAEWLRIQLEPDHSVDELRAGVETAIGALERMVAR